jgi:hypothetical protein
MQLGQVSGIVMQIALGQVKQSALMQVKQVVLLQVKQVGKRHRAAGTSEWLTQVCGKLEIGIH